MKTSWNSNFNLIIYAQIIIAVIGISWLALNNVPSGNLYITIFLVAIGAIFLTFLFLKEEEKSVAKQLIKSPFTVDYDVASGLFLLGWLTPILVNFIIKLTGSGFNISQIMIPLQADKVISEIALTFDVAQAQASPFWQWFISVFTAGAIEEFAFGFALMLVGTALGMLVWRLITKEPYGTGSKWFSIIFALIFSGLLFGGAHGLNATYIGYMFVIAIIFRLIMNLGIYVFGLFLTFTMGYHQSNNAVWYFNAYGANATWNALFSPGGLILLAFFTLIIFYTLRNIDGIAKKLPNVWKRED